jgi:acyl-CoA thioesterase
VSTDAYQHRSPIEEFLGLELEATDRGARGRLAVTPQLYSRAGRVHGGLVFTAIDTVMGLATRNAVGWDKLIATIDISIRYIRTVAEGELLIEVTVVHPGRRVLQLSAEARDDAGRLVAAATGAFMVTE